MRRISVAETIHTGILPISVVHARSYVNRRTDTPCCNAASFHLTCILSLPELFISAGVRLIAL